MTITGHERHDVEPVRSADPTSRSAGLTAYDEQVAALTDAYHHTVEHIMTNRYGPDWASRGDLPDEAYTTELDFGQWLSDLLDHIDTIATPPSNNTQAAQTADPLIPLSAPVPI